MNKSGLSFPSDMNTTDSYKVHHFSANNFNFDTIYEEQQPTSIVPQPISDNAEDQMPCMCPSY
jgi:hypothetical protein